MLAESEHAARVHPAVLRLGLAYADGSVTGGNARCVALLSTLRAVLQVRPPYVYTPLKLLDSLWLPPEARLSHIQRFFGLLLFAESSKSPGNYC